MDKRGGRTMVWAVIIIIAVIAALLLIVGLIDGNRFVVVEEKLVLPGLSKKCRFVLLSDLHNKEYGEKNCKVIDAIEKADPDFILFVGDLITDHVGESMEPGISLINELSRKYRIYFSLGNHETKIDIQRDRFHDMYDKLMKGIEHKNVTVLKDEQCLLPGYGINLVGLNLDRKYFARFKKVPLDNNYLVKKLGIPKPGYCNILMAHNPLYFEDYSQWGADLVVAGHVHGGIMRLPVIGGVISPAYTLFPKYDGGVFKYRKSTMLLGRGMGSHTIPFRFFNPAELYVVDISPTNSLHF